VFLFLLLFYTYGFMALPSICILLSLNFLLIGVLLWALRARVHVFLNLGMLMPVAVIAGSVLGLYTYDVYAIFPMFYAHARVYTDVVSSQPFAAVADAGKLMFTSTSLVDRNFSVGYITERGSTYCVAPVRDNLMPPRVEFWAVGVECCDPQGNFWCDDSRDGKASSGIVVFDNNGIFSTSRYVNYEKARKKAEATFGLISAQKPGYVRWVKADSLNAASDEYRTKAVLSLCGWSFLYILVSGIMAFAIFKPRIPTLPTVV